VAVKVQPKSRQPGLQGIAHNRLRIGVNQAPEGGRANRAACAALADALGLPVSAVRLILGATNREKTLHVTGNPAELGAKLSAL